MASNKVQPKKRREKLKDAGEVILKPRITEKGALVAQHRAYVFDVAAGAGKKDIAVAIAELFKVTPLKVAVAVTRGKKTFTRGANRSGRKPSTKKAYVYLQQGDTIDLV